MRTVLTFGAFSAAILIGGTLLTIQLFEGETTLAGSDPMVVSNIEVFQDTTPVLKGTSMQVVLGLKIITKGKAQHLNFSGMELSARGTSKPFSSYAGNARLWSTGKNNFFLPVSQLGATQAAITEENFRMDGKQKLFEGENYFWITFDVQQVNSIKNSHIDAECISIQIGTLVHEPAISAPPGYRIIQNNIPYYSKNNGDISSLDSWNSLRDGSGSRPVNFNQSTASFHIQSGHHLRNDLNACLTHLVIERNGVLLSSSGIKATQVEIHGGGTWVQEKIIPNPEGTDRLVIRNGGNFIHKNKGRLPGKLKNIESYSNVVLNDYSEQTFLEQCNWGNLIIDSPMAISTDFFNCFKSVKGNLEIRATGKEHFLYSSTCDTINIGGDMVINGGRIILASTKNKTILHINKNFLLKAGLFSDGIPGKQLKGHLEFYPGTQVYLKSGSFILSGKHSHIYFNEEFNSWIQDTAAVLLPDVTLLPGCTLKLAGYSMGFISENKKFRISETAQLDCGTTVINGKGTFQLESSGTISTAHAEGIHSVAAEGSIQTETRNYSSGANYVFTGNYSPQSMGVFATTPIAQTVNTVRIQKTQSAAIVILQQDLNITGRLVMERGSINKNSHSLHSNEQSTAIKTP